MSLRSRILQRDRATYGDEDIPHWHAIRDIGGVAIHDYCIAILPLREKRALWFHFSQNPEPVQAAGFI